MKIAVVDETGRLDTKYRSLLQNIAKTVLKNSGVPENSELCVSFIDDTKMRQLNRMYRNTNRTTDVLSFPQGEEGPDFTLLGDIIISLDTAARHSASYGNTLHEEIKKLIVHGTLHLLGYDHKKNKEAEIMREMETWLLSAVKDL